GRNSLPFQTGTTSSCAPADGIRSRTLAAGCSTVSPSRSGPAKVTRTMRGLMRSTRRTVTWRKRGGSRRTRTGRASATGDGRQHRHLGALGHDRVDVVEVARVLGADEHVAVTAQGA